MTNDHPAGGEELRRLYASSRRDHDGPDDETLVKLLEGRLNAAGRAHALEQLLESPDAAARYRVLLELRDAAPPSRRAARWQPFAAVAAGLLVTAMLGVLLVAPPLDEPRVRGGSEIASPAALEELSEPPLNLRWPTGDGATGATVAMFNESAKLLWEADVDSAGEYALDADERATLAGGGDFFWIVRVANGTELGPYWFRVSR
jgi:hypothetical protein